MALIRPARATDVERIAAIYDTTIVDSHISFDEEPRPPEHWRQWFAAKSEDGPHQALVAEQDGHVAGVAYSGPWRPKSAYRFSVETTIVLDPGGRGQGLGTALLGALVERLRAAGAHRAIAIVALPNEASIRLHHKLGYRTVGVLDEVGYKYDRYWSTEVLELAL